MSLTLRHSIYPLLVAIASCSAPYRNVDRQTKRLDAGFAAEVERLESLPGETLNWQRALAIQRERNLELRASRNAIASAEDRVRQVFRDLLPGAGISGNVVKSISDLGSLGQEDVALSLYGFLNVPGLLQQRSRYYAACLELMRARWAYELKQRELTIQLHELFLREDVFSQRERNLLASMRWQSQSIAELGLDANPAALEREGIRWSLQRERRAMRTEIARVLGSDAREWRLDPHGLPQHDYLTRPLNLKNARHTGLLFRQLQAVELEGARLAEFGIRLRYWPDLSINLASPPVYQIAGGRAADWSLDQVLVNLSSGLTFDTRGQTASQLAEVRRQVAILRERLAEENTRTIQKLLIARQALELNQKQLRLTELRLEAMRGLNRSLDPARNRDQLERLLALDERRAGLLLENSQLQAMFWFMDERKWQRPVWPIREPQ
jgi:hypothetical protein